MSDPPRSRALMVGERAVGGQVGPTQQTAAGKVRRHERVCFNRGVPASPAKTGMGFMLVHHAASPAFPPHVLMSPVTSLGRQRGNDLVLPSTNVSRRHAKLIVTDLGVTAHDLDSHNGIFVNGKKVRSAPVSPGDRLYVGDVCLELRQIGDNAADHDLNHTVIHKEISDEEDPRVRSLAALLRGAALCTSAADAWVPEVLQVCRVLVDATMAAFVEVQSDGTLQTPVLLQPGLQTRTPVIWPAVQGAIESKSPTFSADVVADRMMSGLGPGDPSAVMVAPVPSAAGPIVAALYLARNQATGHFSPLELETVAVVGRLVGLRLDWERAVTERSASASSRIAVLEARVVELEGRLAASATKIRALDEQNRGLGEEAERLRSGASSQSAEATAKFEAAIVEQRRAAQRDLAALQKELTAAQQAHATSSRDLAAAQEQLAAARREADSLRAVKDAAATESTRYEAMLTSVRAEQQRAVAALNEATSSLAQERVRVEHVEQSRLALERRLEGLQAEQDRQTSRGEESLRLALRTSVLPTVVEHIEAVAGGEAPTTPAVARPTTIVYVALADFDAWCERAAPDVVTRHLDAFCVAVAASVQAHQGRLEQVIGHGHLLSFTADTAGMRAAVRCALEIASVVAKRAQSSSPAVVAGVHSGVAVAGFFGDVETVSHVEAGPAVVVARAAVDFAPKGPDGGARGVLVSEPVRGALVGERGLIVTRLDSSWIRGVNAPVQFSLIDADQGVQS